MRRGPNACQRDSPSLHSYEISSLLALLPALIMQAPSDVLGYRCRRDFAGKLEGIRKSSAFMRSCVAGRDRGDGRVDEPPAFFGRGWPGPKARSRSETRNDSLNPRYR